nr:MFS transporter [Corynebacterium lactis]
MSAVTSDSTSTSTAGRALNPKAAVPVLLFSFVFCLVLDNGFKFMTKPIAESLDLSVSTASLQATLAGILIGIGAVVYAALADSISIRRLMMVGVGFVAVGSLLGFFFQGVWAMVLVARIIQTAGLAAAETLYVIYVTKYLSEADQKTYLGFSTAAFQGSMLIGTLTSGIVATYISWPVMFLIALILLLTVPFLIKTVPEEQQTKGKLDVFGLLLVAEIATAVMWFMQEFKLWWLLAAVLGIALFVWHIRSHSGALVSPSFFTNARYVTALVIVFVVYMVQLGYVAIVLPYMVDELYGISLDGAAYILAPGYLCAVIVGVLSGKIAKFLSSRQAIIAAISLITIALLIPAVFVGSSVATVVVSMILFPSGFALMYAPLVATALENIPAEKTGVAIGFYNLTINIAVPVGIAVTAKLVDMRPTFLSSLSIASTESQGVAATNLWFLAVMALVGLAVYLVSDRVITAKTAQN